MNIVIGPLFFGIAHRNGVSIFSPVARVRFT